MFKLCASEFIWKFSEFSINNSSNQSKDSLPNISTLHYASFEVFTVVHWRIFVFWVVTVYHSVNDFSVSKECQEPLTHCYRITSHHPRGIESLMIFFLCYIFYTVCWLNHSTRLAHVTLWSGNKWSKLILEYTVPWVAQCSSGKARRI